MVCKPCEDYLDRVTFGNISYDIHSRYQTGKWHSWIVMNNRRFYVHGEHDTSNEAEAAADRYFKTKIRSTMS